MTARPIVSRIRLTLAVCAGCVAIATASGCTLLPSNRANFERDLDSGFHGFETVSIQRDESWPFLFLSNEHSEFEYTLKSSREPQFVIAGKYIVTSGDWRRTAQVAYYESNMFNGVLTLEALAALERKWVERHGSEPVRVGYDRFTGPLAGNGSPFSDVAASEQYSKVPLDEVIALEGQESGIECFRRNHATGEWEYLPNFIGPDQFHWEMQ